MSQSPSPLAPHDHFARIVPKWSHFGPPLRPSPDDSAVMQRAASRLGAGARVAVLGLTPEIIACDWPNGVRLSALDHSPAMIRQLWPPAKGPDNSEVLLADWLAMPFADAAIDLVAGDGCYVVQAWPDGFSALTREVHRVLGRGGRYVMRVFLRPDASESVADVGCELGAGRIGSVHALKLRLLAAVHGASGVGSRLDDVWRAWRDMPAIPQALAGERGWTAEEIVGIESYGGMDARYYLPTLAEFRQLVAPYFDERECAFGSHELAERCPTLELVRRD
ncbi:MAG TPA: methyltransferase domain-containing protein [Rudaea sp.]|nr:methyltransferase domain-containing protein [Rudaea sp.]